MTRLIDADELKEDLRQYFTDGVLDGVSARLAFNQILHDIDNEPTIEPERPQGEWITFPTNRLIMQCPECTAFLSRTRSDIFKDSVGEMNFCPNCGASMKKGGAE